MPIKTRFDVVALGNAVVDILSRIDDVFLEKHNLQKGIMTLIDSSTAEKMYSEIPHGIECSGGSAANTAVGIASLGGRPVFVGKVADDELGKIFANDIRKAGVHFETRPLSLNEQKPTGRSFVFVTQDAQRTMHTYLGACSQLTVDDIDESIIADSAITYIEGYLWDKEKAKHALALAAQIAVKNKRKVSLSLSDPFCVERHRQSFLELIDNGVDLVFCNEDEIKTLIQTDDLNEALEKARTLCETVVVTLGSKGAIAIQGNKQFSVPANASNGVVDTTGAGDLFAAGFLAQYAVGKSVEDALITGSLAAEEIISHYGARPSVSLSALLSSKKTLRK